MNKAVEEVNEEEEEYSDNFEDAQSPEGINTEHTEEPPRPSAPVWCT